MLLPRPLSPVVSVDLDVGVPAGSPLDWTRSFPAYSPPREGLFPRTPERAVEPGKERSSSKAHTLKLDFRNSDSFGFTRILTWDIGGHLSWIGPRKRGGPRTGGPSLLPPAPTFGSGLYWVTLAPLLRLLLHPDMVPYETTLAHLIEIGEPTLAVLDSAASEGGLRKAVKDLRLRIAPGSSGPAAKPLAADSIRGAMLSRFCFEELLQVHAYDPEQSFAKRLLLFADETEPWVIRYARTGDAALRRAAVAALARYRSRKAVDVLLERALFSSDAVETVRALAGLSRFRGRIDVAPLLDRLDTESDPIQKSALIAAVGRPGAFSAIEPLLEVARKDIKKRKSGLAIEALAALIRIGPTPMSAPALDEFLVATIRILRTAAAGFRAPATSPHPDRPDSPHARAEVLLQLARILRLRLQPGDPDLLRRLVELADIDAHGAGGGREGPDFGRVHPPVRLLYLEALARAGEDGTQRLLRIAKSNTLTPSLRGHALQNLPFHRRSELALSFLGLNNPDALRLIGFETLLADGHPKLEAAARELILKCSTAQPERIPARDYLFLRAVRTLSEKGKLAMVDLAPLVYTAEFGKDAFGVELEAIRERAQEIVEAWLRGVPRNGIRPMIQALVSYVLQREVNPSITEVNRKQVERYIEGQLASLKAHKSDTNYRRLVISNIERTLLGWAPPNMNRALGQFTTPVALGEEVLLALGRTREGAAADLLVDFLGNRQNQNRYAACLGLGMTGSKKHARVLASFLLDGDPFVRFCAYEALRHVSGLDVEIDWMYGAATERFDGAERYLEWALQNARPPGGRR